MNKQDIKFPLGLFITMLILGSVFAFAGYQASESAHGEAYKDTLITRLQRTIWERDTTIERQRHELGNWHNYEWKCRQIFGVDTAKHVMFKRRQ